MYRFNFELVNCLFVVVGAVEVVVVVAHKYEVKIWKFGDALMAACVYSTPSIWEVSAAHIKLIQDIWTLSWDVQLTVPKEGWVASRQRREQNGHVGLI